jgi:FkbM family methyltransferase
MAFEANPATHGELSLNMRGTCCVCSNEAVGFSIGEVFIKCDPECPEASYISDHGESVRLTTLDEVYGKLRDYFDKTGVSVVKIDVEGFEPNVLKGSEGLISKFRPVIVPVVFTLSTYPIGLYRTS